MPRHRELGQEIPVAYRLLPLEVNGRCGGQSLSRPCYSEAQLVATGVVADLVVLIVKAQPTGDRPGGSEMVGTLMIECQPQSGIRKSVCIRSIRARSIVVDERRHGGGRAASAQPSPD